MHERYGCAYNLLCPPIIIIHVHHPAENPGSAYDTYTGIMLTAVWTGVGGGGGGGVGGRRIHLPEDRTSAQ